MTVRGLLFLISESVHVIRDVTHFCYNHQGLSSGGLGAQTTVWWKESGLHLVANPEESETSSGQPPTAESPEYPSQNLGWVISSVRLLELISRPHGGAVSGHHQDEGGGL